MKALFTTIFSMLCFGLSFGQITFTQGDFPTPGKSIEYLMGWSDSINVGMAGANMNFDFSGVLGGVDTSEMMNLVSPAATGHGSSHPNSTVAYLGDTEKDSATQQTVLEIYQFIKVTSTDATYDGVTVNVDTGNLFSGSPPSAMIAVHANYNPKEEFIGTNWTYGQTLTTSSNWNVTLGPLTHNEHKTRNINIDAWGTFTNPWHSFDALRFKVSEFVTGTDSINGNLDDSWTDTMYYYEFWIKELGNYIARLYTDSTYTDFWYFEMAKQLGPVGIENNSDLETEVKMYPNPVRNVLNIEMDIKGKVQFEVLDLQGRRIANGKLISREAGLYSLDMSDLNKGKYLLKLSQGQKIIASKMIFKE